jgi:UDP-sugar diphosphatase
MEFIVEDFKLEPLKDGKFIKPAFATFKLNGQNRDWEIVDSKDSVAILIFNSDNNSFVCVKQFRPAVYAHNKNSGVTIELCAGLVDKNLTLEQIAIEEIFEETGYKVALDSLKKITSFYTSVGFAGSKQHLYFTEVNNSLKVSSGGGIEGEELIEVIEIPLHKAKEFIYNEDIAKTPGLLFAFEWFINNRS